MKRTMKLNRIQGGKLTGSGSYGLIGPNKEINGGGSNVENALYKVSARAVEIAQLYENSFKNSYGNVE